MAPDFAEMSPKDFPHWKDKNCPHALEDREMDGTGWVCMRCGVVAWR